MSGVQAVATAKFLRKTTLRETEANTNFKMLDDDVAEAITSAEADAVTPLMCKIYTRLLLTPPRMREGERVLRFAGEEREGKWLTAWEQLRGHLRVSGETASKALRWMHGRGIIGYYAGKNGVGIRIFLNRAASSVVSRSATRPQKILPFGRASECRARTPSAETPFKDSYAVSEALETDLNPRAPKSGADKQNLLSSPKQNAHVASTPAPAVSSHECPATWAAQPAAVPLDEIVSRLKRELEPALQSLARQAAAREHERTREWLESKGLPKAARVAQRETYNVLRRQAGSETPTHTRHAQVGRAVYTPPAPKALPDGEVEELAEVCLALYEAKGQAVAITVSEMCVESGGFLLPADASRVLEKVERLLTMSRPITTAVPLVSP